MRKFPQSIHPDCFAASSQYFGLAARVKTLHRREWLEAQKPGTWNACPVQQALELGAMPTTPRIGIKRAPADVHGERGPNDGLDMHDMG